VRFRVKKIVFFFAARKKKSRPGGIDRYTVAAGRESTSTSLLTGQFQFNNPMHPSSGCARCFWKFHFHIVFEFLLFHLFSEKCLSLLFLLRRQYQNASPQDNVKTPMIRGSNRLRSKNLQVYPATWRLRKPVVISLPAVPWIPMRNLKPRNHYPGRTGLVIGNLQNWYAAKCRS